MRKIQNICFFFHREMTFDDFFGAITFTFVALFDSEEI